ncbi:MAG: cytochrome c family protein [Pseudomonadota bacterium]
MSRKLFVMSGILATGLFAASSNAFALDGDAVKGEKVFKKCASCHMVGPEAKNRVGPVLTGVVGRTAGTFEDYKYGKSIISAGEAGLVWTEEELSEYLINPKKYLRAKLEDKKAKSKMSFKLKKEQERADVIAYLKTFSPEAEEVAEEEAEATEGESVEEEAATTN